MDTPQIITESSTKTEDYYRLEKIWRALKYAHDSGFHRNEAVKMAMDNISADMASEMGGYEI